jgi:hypothetical protein
LVRELADHQNEGEYATATIERWRDLLGRGDVVVLVAKQAGESVGYVSD